MVEFVSANPTGPLHMGNARGGALGDCIASVLKRGHDVTREYYINVPAIRLKFEFPGSQIYSRLKGEDAIEFPEDGYHGEDIIERVKSISKKTGTSFLM